MDDIYLLLHASYLWQKRYMQYDVMVIGAGLAGSEAAWQLAESQFNVLLVEMKPHSFTAAQVSPFFSELVCSNSLRSSHVHNAVGLIKEEMRALHSLIIRMADTYRVPAGDALAVDREKFSAAITHALKTHPRIHVESRVVEKLPLDSKIPVIVATGPLTHGSLAEHIAQITGQERLYFYDAIAPIVLSSSLNRDKIFAASRYGKGDGSDYLNCPMSQSEYEAFYHELINAEYMSLHDFEEPKYFQGCQPIEMIAKSGPKSLLFGPMKPVGLRHPMTGERFHAVVQLRQEDKDAQAFNLVGFQTKMKYPEQKRVFSMIPGLEHAEFVRLGAIHRNTYLDAPSLLNHHMQLHTHPHIRFAGQITGVEGYVESAAHGLLTSLLLCAELKKSSLSIPKRTTALGALWSHVCGTHRLPNRPHEPHNINWGLFEPLEGTHKKSETSDLRVQRAQRDFQQWLSECV